MQLFSVIDGMLVALPDLSTTPLLCASKVTGARALLSHLGGRAGAVMLLCWATSAQRAVWDPGWWAGYGLRPA